MPFRNSLFKEPADLKTQHRSNVKVVEGSACSQETQGLGSPDSPESLGELHGGGAMGWLVPLVCESLQSRDHPLLPFILVSLSLPEHRKH